MSYYKAFQQNIPLGYTPPTSDGRCPSSAWPSDRFYTGCTHNGKPHYMCQGAGGYQSAEDACKSVSKQECSGFLHSGENPFPCSGDPDDPDDHGDSDGPDPSAYCECRKQICGDNHDCAPTLSVQDQTALKNCCPDQDCINYAQDDISGFHINPCPKDGGNGGGNGGKPHGDPNGGDPNGGDNNWIMYVAVGIVVLLVIVALVAFYMKQKGEDFGESSYPSSVI